MTRSSGQGGFTLPEVLVAMVMMSFVIFALYAVFDAGVRVFTAGHDGAEAAQNARQALARIEREIRAAYPRDKANGDNVLLTDFREDGITFGNDVGKDPLGGNRRTHDPSTGAYEPGERITYGTNAGGAPVRNGVRLARHAGDVDGDGRALSFTYLDAQGGPVVGGDERDVALVGIRLEVVVDRPGERPVERILRSKVALRNR